MLVEALCTCESSEIVYGWSSRPIASRVGTYKDTPLDDFGAGHSLGDARSLANEHDSIQQCFTRVCVPLQSHHKR